MHHIKISVAKHGLATMLSMFAVVVSAHAEMDPPPPLAEMRAIYTSLKVLLPLSVNNDAFSDIQNRKAIRAALAELGDYATRIGDHAKGRDPRTAYLGGALGRESLETLRRYERGEFDSARFYVQRMTDYCSACHSRLPSPTDSSLSRNFLSDAELSALPIDRRALLQVATRRFDEALSSFESYFVSEATHPAELLEPLTVYLEVAIRVKGDLGRPIAALRKISSRPRVWRSLRSDIEEWIKTLERYRALQARAPDLRSVREILSDASGIIEYPADRRALVHYLLASAQLHQFIEARPADVSNQIAEAYYRLGLIESRLNRRYLVAESEFYLETAIRMAPATLIAEQSFTVLEEGLVLGWSGSGGDFMPAAVRLNLEELRGLAQPGSARRNFGDLPLRDEKARLGPEWCPEFVL